MEYEELVDDLVAVAPMGARHMDARHSVATRAVVRFGGFSLHRSTRSIFWLMASLSLREEEHALLALFIEHAGQILSLTQIAALLGRQQCAEVELHVSALQQSLHAQGVPRVPRRVEGLGYILWH